MTRPQGGDLIICAVRCAPVECAVKSRTASIIQNIKPHPDLTGTQLAKGKWPEVAGPPTDAYRDSEYQSARYWSLPGQRHHNNHRVLRPRAAACKHRRGQIIFSDIVLLSLVLQCRRGRKTHPVQIPVPGQAARPAGAAALTATTRMVTDAPVSSDKTSRQRRGNQS